MAAYVPLLPVPADASPQAVPILKWNSAGDHQLAVAIPQTNLLEPLAQLFEAVGFQRDGGVQPVPGWPGGGWQILAADPQIIKSFNGNDWLDHLPQGAPPAGVLMVPPTVPLAVKVAQEQKLLKANARPRALGAVFSGDVSLVLADPAAPTVVRPTVALRLKVDGSWLGVAIGTELDAQWRIDGAKMGLFLHGKNLCAQVDTGGPWNLDLGDGLGLSFAADNARPRVRMEWSLAAQTAVAAKMEGIPLSAKLTTRAAGDLAVGVELDGGSVFVGWKASAQMVFDLHLEMGIVQAVNEQVARALPFLEPAFDNSQINDTPLRFDMEVRLKVAAQGRMVARARQVGEALVLYEDLRALADAAQAKLSKIESVTGTLGRLTSSVSDLLGDALGGVNFQLLTPKVADLSLLSPCPLNEICLPANLRIVFGDLGGGRAFLVRLSLLIDLMAGRLRANRLYFLFPELVSGEPRTEVVDLEVVALEFPKREYSSPARTPPTLTDYDGYFDLEAGELVIAPHGAQDAARFGRLTASECRIYLPGNLGAAPFPGKKRSFAFALKPFSPKFWPEEAPATQPDEKGIVLRVENAVFR